jgi:hypothetical protein
MARTVKHFSLHRIAGTELRVVADVEAGVLPVIQAEEAVIRGYAQQGLWPHRWVTLFVLQDLQPLVRQLPPTPSLPLVGGGSKDGRADLPPGGAAALDHRPGVNVYDLADPAGCHVFVNRQAVAKEGYWDDPLVIQGLLAHEHAHPLAENETTWASRQLQVELSLADSSGPFNSCVRCNGSQRPSASGLQPSAINYQPRVHRLLTLLADKLCLYAPREVFANEMTIRSGFGEALLHLDRRNVDNASRSVAGREELCRWLQQEVTQGNLTPSAADVLLLIGDLNGYLDLALEIAPFYRTGRDAEAQGLEAVLEAEVFPHLEPEVPRAYTALREQYIALRADLTPSELMAWGEGVLDILAEVLAEKGLMLQYSLRVAEGGSE